MKSRVWLFLGLALALFTFMWSCNSYPPTAPNYGSGTYPNRYVTPSLTVTSTPTLESTPAYVNGWTVSGPNGLAYSSGYVFAAEGDGQSVSQVQVFNPSGGSAVTQWSAYAGTTFLYPNGAAANSSDLYILDAGNPNSPYNGGAVYEFNASTFVPVTSWGSYGSTPLSTPGGIALDSTGNVYVADSGNWALEEYSSSGTPIGVWETDYHGYPMVPMGVAVDSAGNVYVADGNNDRMWSLSVSGGVFTVNTVWALPLPPSPFLSDIQFYSLAVDGNGNIVLADYDNSLVEVYSSTGSLLAELTGNQTGATAFGGPSAVLFYNSDFYVGDYDANTVPSGTAGNIQVFGPVSY